MKKKPQTGIRLDQFANSLGHINEKKFFNLLYPNSKVPRSKPDLNQDAHTTTLCNSQKNSDQEIDSLLSKIETIKSKDRLLYFIAHLQLIGGLRISEVLSIAPEDITSTGHVHINSKKGSAQSVIYAGNAANYLINCRANSVYPFNMYSRFYCYRQFKKYGIKFDSVNSSKVSVTHALRHLGASAQRQSNFDQDTIQTFLRHKSANSTQYYGKSKKK